MAAKRDDNGIFAVVALFVSPALALACCCHDAPPAVHSTVVESGAHCHDEAAVAAPCATIRATCDCDSAVANATFVASDNARFFAPILAIVPAQSSPISFVADARRVLGQRYREVKRYNVKRPFMPMMAETSPMFSAQFPDIANAFDNLHMLHDMVNDVLATDGMTDSQKKAAIKLAIYQMSPDAHKDCVAGEDRGVIDGISHDHRFMQGMKGMGTMKGNETQTETMWMPTLGWMDMSTCHHCSMPLDDNGIGDKAWRASSVSADGWTLRVRCACVALYARTT